MDNNNRFVTGLDVGTENVRAVIASVNNDGKIAIVGYNEGKSAGMRKGIPANLAGPAGAIDKMLGDAERMGGYDVRSAYVCINGATVISTHTEGMIAVGNAEHEINGEDLNRVEDVAVSGRIPAPSDGAVQRLQFFTGKLSPQSLFRKKNGILPGPSDGDSSGDHLPHTLLCGDAGRRLIHEADVTVRFQCFLKSFRDQKKAFRPLCQKSEPRFFRRDDLQGKTFCLPQFFQQSLRRFRPVQIRGIDADQIAVFLFCHGRH